MSRRLLKEGQLLARRFRVEELVTRRPGSETARARDLMGSPVIVKRFAVPEAARRRLEQRVRRARRLHSEHVVPLQEASWDGEDMLIVMPALRGVTLRERLKSGAPLAPEEALYLLRGTLRGLQALQTDGIIHGRIDADHVLLREDADHPHGWPCPVLLGLFSAENDDDKGSESDDVRNVAELFSSVPMDDALRTLVDRAGTVYESGELVEAWQFLGALDRLREPLAAGQVVGGSYRLEDKLGCGGSSVVWQATDLDRDEPVALKFLTPPSGVPEYEVETLKQRFAREIKILMGDALPHVVRARAVGYRRDLPFAVLEHVAGDSLDVAWPRLSTEERVRALAQIARALDAVHERGVIHRDVKPENILLRRADDDQVGEALLIDFGVAKMGEFSLTQTGSVVGTPGYMAPEILRAEPPSPAADQWSLAATVYRLLTGTMPGQDTTPGAAYENVATGNIEPLSELCPGVPLSVDAAVMRALSPRPTQRFDSCAEFVRTLAEAWGIADLTAPPERLFHHPMTGMPERVVKRQLLIMIIILVGGSFGAGAWFINGFKKASPSPASTDDRRPPELRPVPPATSDTAPTKKDAHAPPIRSAFTPAP